jgi:hypothetical protein
MNALSSTRMSSATGAVLGAALAVALWEQLGRRWWVVLAVVVVGAAVAVSVERLDAVAHPAELPVAAALTLLAVAACVPETDHLARVGVWCVVAAAVAGVTPPIVARRLVVGSALVLVGWASLFGAVARPSAIIGSLVAFVPVVVVGVVRPSGWPLRVGSAALCYVAAAAMARTGGVFLGGGVGEPLGWAALWCAVMATCGIGVAAWDRRVSAARSVSS